MANSVDQDEAANHGSTLCTTRLNYFYFCTLGVKPTGGLFNCYMLDKSICHFRGVGSILSLLFYFFMEILLANNVDPDNVASDLGSEQCRP